MARGKRRLAERAVEKQHAKDIVQGKKSPVQVAVRERAMAKAGAVADKPKSVTKPKGVGARWLKFEDGPDAPKVRISVAEIDRAWDLYKANSRFLAAVPGVDRSDFESVARYLQEHRHTWKDVLAGGDLGASLVLHELVEMQEIRKLGLDPYHDRQQRKGWKQAHPFALQAEHEFLLSIARQKGYNLKSILPLVWENPHVPKGDAKKDANFIKRLSPEPVMGPGERKAAREFFAELEKER